VAEKESDIGIYVGILGSAYYGPLLFSSIIWGYLSDLIGRKPILLLGLIGSAISSMVLGLSSSFEMAVLGRMLAGLFAANSTVAKGMLGDLTEGDPTYARPKAFSLYGMTFGFANIIGPLAGGYLTNPVIRFPTIFDSSILFNQFPYALPCLFSSFLCIICWIIVYFFLHDQSIPTLSLLKFSSLSEYEPIEDEISSTLNLSIDTKDENASSPKMKYYSNFPQQQPPSQQLHNSSSSISSSLSSFYTQNSSWIFSFYNHPLVNSSTLIAISAYFIFAFLTLFYHTTFSLWSASPIGLHFTSDSIATCVSIIGFVK